MTQEYNEPEDLLSDESFLTWYFRLPKEKHVGEHGDEHQKWERWISEDPTHAHLVQQAASLLESARLPEQALPILQIAQAEEHLMQAIQPKMISSFTRRRWMVAAVIFGLLSIGLVITAIRSTKATAIKTAFGELASRQLPDGTEVTMDANSRISFAGSWSEDADREVWMNGEAFFHVRKTRQHNRFIVHLEHADIIVTGTKFNVINRHGVENILLEEGSVTLKGKDGRQLTMLPGEFVALNEDDKAAWEKRTVQKDSLLAWKEQRLIFDGTPLRELVTIINDHYGVHIRLADAATGAATVSAILPNNNLDVLLAALDATAEFDIIRKGDQITIRARSGGN